MSNKDYEKYVWELYEREMESRNNSNYEADLVQFQKLIDAYGFFMELAALNNGRVEPLKLVPKEVSGGITAYFTVFYLTSENIQRFCDVVRDFAALSIDSMNDGSVCISFTIPKVFRRKEN